MARLLSEALRPCSWHVLASKGATLQHPGYYRYLFLDWISYARNHGCHPRQVSSAHQDGARPQGADRLNVGWTIWLRGTTPNPQAPVAQLDRAPDFESGGQGFESLPARQLVWPLQRTDRFVCAVGFGARRKSALLTLSCDIDTISQCTSKFWATFRTSRHSPQGPESAK